MKSPNVELTRARAWRLVALFGVAVILLTACGGTTGTSTLPPAGVSSATSNATPASIQTTPGTPVSAAGLPMTVTANGVTVELQSVDSTSAATRFSFLVQGSPGRLPRNQGFPTVLGSNPADDVTIDGLTPAQDDPLALPRLGIGGNRNIGFTLDYQSPFPPGKTVTITIQRLTLPAENGTPAPSEATGSQPIEGPWTFTITPDAVANQPMPTPSGGIDRFDGVTVTQAQKWSNFPITAPSPLPPVLSQALVVKRNEFNVNGYALGVPETAPANYVLFTYDQPLGQVVFLAETTNDAAVPNINGQSATMLMPIEPAGKTGTFAISRGTLSHPTIDGVDVTRFEVSNSAGNGPTIYYVWKLGGIDCYIWHMMDTSPPGMTTVTDEDLQQMVASIIEQRRGAVPATVTSGPPLLTFAQAKQIVSFYVADPTWVPSYLVNKGVVIGVPPRQTPTPRDVHHVSLEYGPTDIHQQYSVVIREFDSTQTPHLYDGTSATITVEGQAITRTVATRARSTDPHLIGFTWTYRNTFFWVDVEMGGPVTEQDVEHRIASMLGG